MVWPSPWFVNSEFWPWQIWGILVKTLVCHGPAKSYKKLVIVLVPTQKRWDNFDPSISGQDPGRRVNTTIAGAARSDLSHWDHRISWILSLQTVDGWLRCFPYPPLIKAGNEINNSSKKVRWCSVFCPCTVDFPAISGRSLIHTCSQGHPDQRALGFPTGIVGDPLTPSGAIKIAGDKTIKTCGCRIV